MVGKIAFAPPDISEADIQAVIETLRSGWITTGPKTKQFETEIAAYCGTQKAACFNSATAAMELALRLIGIGPGDEVITSAYTYTASASVADHVGAKVVLVDTASGSYFMDPDKLCASITPKTKAIIPVDIAGVPCDYSAIYAAVESCRGQFVPNSPLQESFGRVLVLADAAHSFGAQWGSGRSGALADFTSFSFHAVKNLTTAEGGALTWRSLGAQEDEALYKKLMLLCLHGQTKDALAKEQVGAWEYDIAAPWYKCNMTDISAALGLSQLARYEALMTRRRELVRLYSQRLSEKISLLAHETQDYRSCCHLLLARLPGFDETTRNAVISRLGESGIAANVHYKPLPMLTAYKQMGFDIADFPNAYKQYRNELTLPLHTRLTDEDVESVCDALLDIMDAIHGCA